MTIPQSFAFGKIQFPLHKGAQKCVHTKKGTAHIGRSLQFYLYKFWRVNLFSLPPRGRWLSICEDGRNLFLKQYFYFKFLITFGAFYVMGALFYRQTQNRLTVFAGAVTLFTDIAKAHKVCGKKRFYGVYHL